MIDLRTIARALGGEVSGRRVLCPGPGHSPRDRSLSITLSATNADGFIVTSHAGDDWRDCRDHVKRALGLPLGPGREERPKARRPEATAVTRPVKEEVATTTTTDQAMALWRQGVDPRGTLAELYLNDARKLDLGDDLCGEVLRWHPVADALLALFRNVLTGEPQAVSRIFIDRDGRKIERKFLGPVAGAAVMLDPFEDVLGGLHVGEGVETCMAARQLGLRPTWALGSAAAIAAFPILSGVECLTLLQENDANGASQRACEACALRWHAAGHEVIINTSNHGGDLADAIRLMGLSP